MKGTLQGDFSRFVFDRRRHDRAVLMQQGRVQLDADWNSQAAILDYLERTSLGDLIGPSGAPAVAPGFALHAQIGLTFDGVDDYLRIGGARVSTFRSASGMTLELNVAPRLGSAGGTLISRWARPEATDPIRNLFVLAFRDDGSLVFEREGVEQVDLERDHPKKLAFGRLQHLAMVADANATLIYLDGEVAACFRGGCGFDEAESSFHLGAHFHKNQPTRCFAGFLTQFRVWSAPLSEDQIRKLAAGAEPPSAIPSLLGWWSFADASETRVEDRTPHHNAAVLGGKIPEQRPVREVKLEIGPGRFYVDGILCENEAAVSFGAQPDFPGADLPQPGSGSDLHLFYLEAWERTISVLEDPAMREVALGGPDTTLRSRVVAQVKSLPVSGEVVFPRPAGRFPEWQQLLAKNQQLGQLVARLEPTAAELGNLLYRVEIHSAGALYGSLRSSDPYNPAIPVDSVLALRQDETAAASELDLGCEPWPAELRDWQAGDTVEVWSDLAKVRSLVEGGPPVGILTQVTAIEPATKKLTLRGPLADCANEPSLQLRRIATFKWSRTNANAAYPISEHNPGSPVVHLGYYGREGMDLEPGQWVEVVDDHSVLCGHSHPLSQVQAIDDFTLQVTLDPPPRGSVGSDPALHPLLRCFDHSPTSGLLSGGAIVAQGHNAWQPLEAGLQVQFVGSGTYRAGDYWWLPTRTLTQELEWPGEGTPLAQPPAGIARHFAPLGLLRLSAGQCEVIDLRQIFQPSSSGAVSKAGDVMDGPLEIRADLKVLGNAQADTFYGGLGTPAIVNTHHLVDGAITADKIAAHIGVLHPGFCILSPDPMPPPGYVATGVSLDLPLPNPPWVNQLEIPSAAPTRVKSVELAGKIYSFADDCEVWVVDPQTRTWASRCPCPYPRRDFAVAALAGKIFLVGGLDTVDRPMPSTLEYDPLADVWTQRADLPTARAGLAVVACQDKLFALGGLRSTWLGKKVTGRVEVYDPSTDTWSKRRRLPHARSGLAAIAIGHSLLAIGGERRILFGRWGRMLSRLNQEYLVAPDRWTRERAPLPVQRKNHGLAQIGSQIFAVGGIAPFGWLDDNLAYDLGTDTWQASTSLPQPIDAPGIAARNGKLFAIGGRRTPDASAVLVQECALALRLYVYRFAPRNVALKAVVEDGGW